LAQNIARENHYVLDSRRGKRHSENSRSKKRGSGEHLLLRPVIRAIASEPRRSCAIRAPPLPNSIPLAATLGVVLAKSWASHFAPYPFELSPPARRHKGNAHMSEGRQSLHCLPSEQCCSVHLAFQTAAPANTSILLIFNHLIVLTCPISEGSIPTWGFSLCLAASNPLGTTAIAVQQWNTLSVWVVCPETEWVRSGET
jgi:hypothetical protein